MNTSMLDSVWHNVPSAEKEWEDKRTLERMFAPMDLREKIRRFCRWRHECGTGTLNSGPYTDYEYRFLLYVAVATSVIDMHFEGEKVANDRLRRVASRLGYDRWKSDSNFECWRYQIKHMIFVSDRSWRAGLRHRAMESIYYGDLPPFPPSPKSGHDTSGNSPTN